MTIQKSIIRSWVLVILGVVYLALLAATFIFGIDLATDKTMQYMLHVTLILSAFAYVLFVDAIYGSAADKTHARPALIFAAGFSVPVIIGRGIGLAAITSAELYVPDSLFNFYAPVSISMTIEVISWTTLFPLSMLFLGRLFFKDKRVLGCLCFASAVCCFVAFLSFFSSSAFFLFIGILGWGVLFLLVAIVYLAAQIKEKRLVG